MKYLIPKLLLAYFIFAISTAVFTDSGAIPPFFNGHWFVKTPHTINDYGLLIESIDGQKLNPPAYLEQIINAEFPRAWPFAAYNVTQVLGKAFKEKQFTLLKAYLEVLNTQTFSSRQVELKLMKRSINSLEFINSGKTISAQVLMDLQTGKK